MVWSLSSTTSPFKGIINITINNHIINTNIIIETLILDAATQEPRGALHEHQYDQNQQPRNTLHPIEAVTTWFSIT